MNERGRDAHQLLTKRPMAGQEQEDTTSTHCAHSPVPAAKTPISRQASLHYKHWKVQHSSGGHFLMEPAPSLSNRACSDHKRPLSYYCSQDASIICSSCFIIGDHKGHLVQPVGDTSEKKREKLKNMLKKCHVRKEKTLQRIVNLREKICCVRRQASSITGNMASLFTDVRKELAALERQSVEEVWRQEKMAVHLISEQIQDQERQLKGLLEQISHGEDLCEATDPLSFMQGLGFAESTPNSTQETNRRTSQKNETLDEVLISEQKPDQESQLNDSLEQITPGKERCEATDPLSSLQDLRFTDSTPGPAQETNQRTSHLDEVLISVTLQRNLTRTMANMWHRSKFCVTEASDVSLSLDSAGDFAFISGDMKMVCKSQVNLLRPETPGRFYCSQVVSRESFSSGRHAWEVETSGCGDWMVGVAYHSLERKGPLSFLGINPKSWCLQKTKRRYLVKHNTEENLVYPESSCRRFLIYLDCEADQLSFYQLSDPITHLHTYNAHFTEPLHAAIMVDDGAWVAFRS